MIKRALPVAFALAAMLVFGPGSAWASLDTTAAIPDATPDKSGKVVIGTPYAWDGSTATGFNQYYWDPAGVGAIGPLVPETCTKDQATYCDTVLLEFSNPLTQDEIDAGVEFKDASARVTLNSFTPTNGPTTDFDLLVYASDAQGTKGDRVASDGNLQNTTQERVSFPIETTIEQPSQFYLVHIVYYMVVNGSYKGSATLT